MSEEELTKRKRDGVWDVERGRIRGREKRKGEEERKVERGWGGEGEEKGRVGREKERELKEKKLVK